eukprot:GFYU01002180.1.p1 GENE.GFYU01002180.1~~GFYU01002180.1.p1  ORF type:complete len:130 (-),score=30.87 GFYU01002180.1:234-587(-)
MDDFGGSEENGFPTDDIQTLVRESIDVSVANATFQHNKVHHWTSGVIEQCLKRLSTLNRPFKYMVTCVIVQRNGAGMHTASSCFWDPNNDGFVTVRWENKTMSCFVTVYGAALNITG